jgi:drug/metabolite transporter (DMT)-like permease
MRLTSYVACMNADFPLRASNRNYREAVLPVLAAATGLLRGQCRHSWRQPVMTDTTKARWWMLAPICMWGCSFVATKALLREVSVVTIIVLRFGLGTALLFAILLRRGEHPLPPRSELRSLALMGFIGIFVHQLVQVTGLRWTSATNTGWLIGLVPIWSAILAGLFLKERFSGLKIAGLVGGFAGAALVISRGRLTSFLHLPATKGDFLVLLSTLNWAVYSIVGHGTLKRLGAARATAGMMLLGWLMVLPIFIVNAGWQEIPRLSLSGWMALLFLGFGSSGLGYYLYYAALEKLSVSQVASFLYVQPLITLASAMVALGEHVQPVTILGGAVVLMSVLLIQRSQYVETPDY